MKQTSERWAYLNTPLERSLLWSLAITIVPVLSSFVVSWVIARFAGPRVVGTVSWVMAFATVCLIAGKFGIGLAASRLASEYGVKQAGSLRVLFKAALELRLLFTFSVAALALVLAPSLASAFHDQSLTNPIRIGAGIIVCASVYEFKENFLIGLNRFHTVYKIRSVSLLSRIVFTVIIVALGLEAAALLSGYCAAWIIASSIYLYLLLKFLPEESGVTKRRLVEKRLFQLCIPLSISSASVTIYSQMDKLMLGYFCGVEEVGQYAIARNVAEVSLFPVFALTMTLRPALASKYSLRAVGECSRIIRRTLYLSLLSGVLFAAIFGSLAVPLITTVYSERFHYAGTLMALFIWVIAMRSLGAAVLPALIAAEETKVYAYLTALSAIINFVLNLVLIPSFRSSGAVFATIASYAFLLVLGLRHVFRIFGFGLDKKDLFLAFRTIIAGAVSGGFLWKITDHTSWRPSVFFWVFALVFAYAVMLFVLHAVSVRDIKKALSGLK